MRLSGSVVEAATLLLVRQSNSQNEVFVVNGNDETFRDVFFIDDIQKTEEGLTPARVRRRSYAVPEPINVKILPRWAS